MSISHSSRGTGFSMILVFCLHDSSHVLVFIISRRNYVSLKRWYFCIYPSNVCTFLCQICLRFWSIATKFSLKSHFFRVTANVTWSLIVLLSSNETELYRSSVILLLSYFISLLCLPIIAKANVVRGNIKRSVQKTLSYSSSAKAVSLNVMMLALAPLYSRWFLHLKVIYIPCWSRWWIIVIVFICFSISNDSLRCSKIVIKSILLTRASVRGPIPP